MTGSLGDLVAAMDSAMVVVTVAVDDQHGGCLVGFHCQCSIEPERYAVWLSRANHTYRLALFADHLAVHLLRPGDEAIAEHWGGISEDGGDKFAGVSWTPGIGGVPLLVDVPRRIVGRKRTVVDEGSDHVCFVVEPVEVHGPDDEPPLRLSSVADVEPGHPATDRPIPDLHRPVRSD